jgi:hypothetical protein
MDGKFSYKSMFNIKNRDELLELLTKTSDGVEWDNLKDTYQGVDQDLEVTFIGYLKLTLRSL